MLQWTLPAGVTAGDIDWPTPHRIVIGERGLKEGLIEYQGRRDKEAQRIALADCAAFLLGRLQS